MSTKKWLVLILFLGFFLRIFLIPKTFHIDLVDQAEWGQRAFQTTTKNFYIEPNWILSKPNHPPLTILYYKANYFLYRQLSLRLNQSKFFLKKLRIINENSNYYKFTDSLDKIDSAENPFPRGYLLTLKLIPIISDILIAIIIFNIAQKKSKKPLVYPSLFLFMPFSWYISSLWGQTDQLSFLFLILSFICINKKSTLSIVLFYLSVAIKPTSITITPLFLFLLHKNKTKISSFINGILISLLITFITFKPFYITNIFDFTFNQLLPRLADRPPRLSTNIYNFWHIFSLNNPVSSQIKILFLSATSWSILIFCLINLFVFTKIKKVNLKTILISLFIISFSSCFFLTNMLDRYAFTSIVSGLIILIYYPNALSYWLIIASIFSLNIYRLWWFPQSFHFLKEVLTFKKYIIGIPFCLINLFCFTQILKRLPFIKGSCPKD